MAMALTQFISVSRLPRQLSALFGHGWPQIIFISGQEKAGGAENGFADQVAIGAHEIHPNADIHNQVVSGRRFKKADSILLNAR
jgi:hypothetical protein